MRFFIYTLALVSLLCSSCNKWLDVKPEDRFIEEQLYSTPQGFYDVLNGFYIRNGSNDMYGARLTMTTMDVLAQLYAVNSGNSSHYLMSLYNYTDATSLSLIDNIWTNHYLQIAGVNKYLSSLEQYGQVLTDNTRDMYKGEALALRAFYYFDLLRLFTPAMAKDSLTPLLPYYSKATAEIAPYQSSSVVMQRILDDLGNAEQLLLKSDPAVSQAVVSAPTLSISRTTRNYHMNYYAVKALKARAYLWRGDKPSALAEASAVIQAQTKFPWVTTSDLNNAAQCNKIFSTEILFGVENAKLSDIFNNNFSPTLYDMSLLAPNSTGTFINTTIFEGQATDYRNQYSWKIAGKPYPTFFKYQDVSFASLASNKTVPLIRMSEMYLIAAEAEPNTVTALTYLNALRLHRNTSPLPDATTAAQLTTSIMKEYRREFYGEGQLFFYYKRTQAPSIIAGGTNTSLTMKDSYYTFAKPLSETTPR